MASPTVLMFSASSSGISTSNSSSIAITSSTISRLSAPRSSMNEDSGLISSSPTPSWSAMIDFTLASMFVVDICILQKRPGPDSNGPSPTAGAVYPTRPVNPTSSLHVHPTIDLQDLASDVRRGIAGEKCYGVRHFQRAPQSPEWNCLQHPGSDLRGELGGHVGLNQTWRDCIHPDVSGSQFPGHRLGQSNQSCLGCAVGSLTDVSCFPHHRGDVDDHPPALLDHRPSDGADQRERPAQIGVQLPVPVLVFDAHHQGVDRDSGVVDQHVDPSVLGDHLLDRLACR